MPKWWGYLLLLLLAYNLFAFQLMGFDKSRARRGGRRIRERTLLWLAALLAGPGIWAGMYIFRHKTKHTAFRLLAPLCTVLEYGAALVLWLWLR